MGESRSSNRGGGVEGANKPIKNDVYTNFLAFLPNQ
jgi:hypothetical protein